jgi:AbrB family looped-hinge helix DNA binding protein
MFTVAKVTSKGRTTIPQSVRAALHVEPGDLIAWEVGPDGRATVRRVEPLELEYLHAVEATLGEWVSAADEDAYRGL